MCTNSAIGSSDTCSYPAPQVGTTTQRAALGGTCSLAFAEVEIWIEPKPLIDHQVRRSPRARSEIVGLAPKVREQSNRPADVPCVKVRQWPDRRRLAVLLGSVGTCIPTMLISRGIVGPRAPISGCGCHSPSWPASTSGDDHVSSCRLLLLMQLHANRQDDVLAYAMSIRAWLEANGGRPRIVRRAFTDPGGLALLR